MYLHFQKWEERDYECVSKAIKNGYKISEIYEWWGLTTFNSAFSSAASRGDVEFLKLMKEWGDMDPEIDFGFSRAMELAAETGHIEIVKLLLKWGAMEIEPAMFSADENGDFDIVKLVRGWDAIHHELFRYHHKRKFYKKLYYDDLLPVAWHPDRFFDWCLDEDEKRELKQMWPNTFSPKTNIFIE